MRRRIESLTRLQLFVGRISALMNPLTYVHHQRRDRRPDLDRARGRSSAATLTQGQVVALVNYMSQILVELIKLANLIINDHQGGSPAPRRIESVS